MNVGLFVSGLILIKRFKQENGKNKIEQRQNMFPHDVKAVVHLHMTDPNKPTDIFRLSFSRVAFL